MRPRSIWASAIHGMTAGAVAWVVITWAPATLLPALNDGRLDQLSLWVTGSVIGGAVLAGRARIRRGAVLSQGLLGVAVGGAASLAAGTIMLALDVTTTPTQFMLFRAASWAVQCSVLAAAIAWCSDSPDRSARRQAVFAGVLGGAVAGMLLALPGPTALWQAGALLLLGATVGVAVTAPPLRSAVAVADRIPRRAAVPGVLSLEESVLFDDASIVLSGATLACHRGRVALHPPPSGVVLNGRAQVAPLFLRHGGTMLVEGERYRIQLLRVAP